VTAAAAPVLAVEALRKRFPDGTEALTGVDLEVRPGEAVALLGHNGSGKSTLMRCVMGFEPLTSGRIRLHDADVGTASRRQLREARRRTAMVFQSVHLVDSSKVLTNVVHGSLGQGGSALRRWSQATAPAELREQAMDALDRVGLAHLAGRRADQLSGGQRQRVGLARMLLQQPRLVLADEPVASLDPKAGRQVMGLLMEIAREKGFTVVTTLHQLDLALSCSDRLVGMREGRVVLDRPTDGLDRAELAGLYEDAARDDEEETTAGEEPRETRAVGSAGAGQGPNGSRSGFDPEAAGLPGRWAIIDPREMNPVRRIKGGRR
jgi:phosphonate transport system ATP-binding protein